MDQNTLKKVNQQVLQERVNSLRNQKEEIRQRLQNPGLYPDSATPDASLSNINEYYRPSQAFKNDLGSVFNYAYDGGSDGGGTYGGTSTSGYTGPAMDAQTAQAIGNITGLVGSYTGALPEGTGQTVSGALSGNPAQAAKGLANIAMSLENVNPYGRMGVNAAIDALSGKSATSVAKGLGLSSLFSAVPQLAQVMALDKGITALSNLFGFDFSISRGLSEMISPTPTAKGFKGGFFSDPGLGAGLGGLGPMGSYGDYGGIGGWNGTGDDVAGYAPGDLGEGIGTTGIGLGMSQGGLQGAMSGFGDYGGGGGDSSTSDPGPSGTGNSGNSGEA